MSVKVYFACVFPDSFWVKPLVPVFKAVTREKSGLFFRRRYTTKLSWSGSQLQLKRMPPFRDAPARRVNERETGASLGLETGTVAAGVEVAGVTGVAETSGVEETNTFGVVETFGVTETDTFGVVETSGVEETDTFGVVKLSGVEEAGTLGVVEISGVVVAGGAGTSDGISVGSVVAVASGTGDAGMWVSRGNSDILEFKEGESVPSEVQPQKSAVKML